MNKKRLKRFMLRSILLLGFIPPASFAGTLHWNVTRADALQEIAATGKKRILLIIGNEFCGGCHNTMDYYAEAPTVKPILEEHYVLWYHDEWVYPRTWIQTFYEQMPPPVTSSLPHSWVIDASDPDNLIALDTRGDPLYSGGIFEDFITPWIPEEPVIPTFSEWVGEQGIPSGEQGAEDCPAGDNVPNLLKYSCGLNAMDYCAPTNLMQTVSSNSTFGIVYYKSTNTVDVQVSPVWSDSLTNDTWIAAGITMTHIGDEGGREIWQGVVPTSGQQGFFRLQAVQE